MADPLTVLGSVASTIQIIDVLTKTVSVLDTLRVQWQSSDIALLSLTSQLGALKAALAKIDEWMQSGIDEIHHQLVMDLNISIGCCEMLATKVYDEIRDLQKAPGGSLLTIAKARFLFKRSGVGELQQMIDRQTAALTLLLTACNSKSLAKQQAILETPSVRESMGRVQEDNASLCGTVDSSSIISRSTRRSSIISLSQGFRFDGQLFSSEPYKAVIKKTVKISTRSLSDERMLPEQVVTNISSNAAGATSPRLPWFRSNPRRPVKQEPQNSTKILLLGGGAAGKTTFIKQLQRTYSSGFSTEERKSWRNIIYENLTTTFQVLARTYWDHLMQDPSRISSFHEVSFIQDDLEKGQKDQLPYGFATVFKALLDRTAQLALPAYGDGRLAYNLDYYIEHLDRLCTFDYIPTSGDILIARTRTTGIHKYAIEIPHHGMCHFYDHGGERSERKKWIHSFDQPLADIMMVFVPLDGYDQDLFEDNHGNPMHEGLMLFESLANSRYFEHSKLFLCFTKYELFKEKIESGLSPLVNEFPDYQGAPTDVVACEDFLAEKFNNLVRQPGKQLGVFCINALDTHEVRRVVETALGHGTSLSPDYFAFQSRGVRSQPSRSGMHVQE